MDSMLNAGGEITFVPELLAVIDRFVRQFEAASGPLSSDMERALLAIYGLGVLSHETDAAVSRIARAPGLADADARDLLRHVLGDDQWREDLLDRLDRELTLRGWVPSEGDH